MIKIYEYSNLDNSEIFDRANPTGDVSEIVAGIIEDVKNNGDEALFRYCEKFDKAKLDSLEVSAEEIEEAFLVICFYFYLVFMILLRFCNISRFISIGFLEYGVPSSRVVRHHFFDTVTLVQ